MDAQRGVSGESAKCWSRKAVVFFTAWEWRVKFIVIGICAVGTVNEREADHVSPCACAHMYSYKESQKLLCDTQSTIDHLNGTARTRKIPLTSSASVCITWGRRAAPTRAHVGVSRCTRPLCSCTVSVRALQLRLWQNSGGAGGVDEGGDSR